MREALDLVEKPFNQVAEKYDVEAKLMELEGVVNPTMVKVHQD